MLREAAPHSTPMSAMLDMRTVVAPCPMNPVPRKLNESPVGEMIAPLARMSASPRAMTMRPSVMMNGTTFERTMKKPLNRPAASPTPTAAPNPMSAPVNPCSL